MKKYIYYICFRCGQKEDVLGFHDKFNGKCSECGNDILRYRISYKKQKTGEKGGVNELMKDRPRWSWSMGVNISQLEQARKLYPESVYNDKGQLLIKNRHHKLQEMKRRNMNLVELD